MKILFALILLASVPAYAVQYIDCVPEPSENNDHVIVSLKDRTQGTLFLSSGINDDGSTDNSGILALTFVKEVNGTSTFHAQNRSSQFDFSFLSAMIQARTFERFSAALSLHSNSASEDTDQKLNCFTRLYK